MSEKKENLNGVKVGNVYYHNDHTTNKEVFKSIFSKRYSDWEARYDKVVVAKKKL